MDNFGIKYDTEKSPKTGQWRYMKPEVDKKKCTGCGTCVKFCPEATIELAANNQKLKTKKKFAEIDLDWCKGCGVCANVCPAKAILMKKE